MTIANLNATDRLALEIGRYVIRAHNSEQMAETLARELAEAKAALAEHENGVKNPYGVQSEEPVEEKVT